MEQNNPAYKYFDKGFYCAESVLLALAKELAIESDLLPRIATAFCSGLSKTKGVCGAVNGAIMAISIKYGRNYPEESTDKPYYYTQEFLERFQEKFGAISCYELTGYDLGDEFGHQQYEKTNSIEKCNKYVTEAFNIAQEIINEQ